MRILYQQNRRRPWAIGLMFSGLVCVITMTSHGYTANARDFVTDQHALYAPVIELDLREATIKEALREIEKQTRYNFVINDSRLRLIQKKITLQIKSDDIEAILNHI